MSEPTSLETLPDEVEAMLARVKPTPAAEYRKHLLQTKIFPTLERWGFDSRFHRELPEMHPKQQKTYDRTLERMKGRGAIVALVGERGLGKTSIAAQFALSVAWANHEESLKESGSPRIQCVLYKKCAKLIARFKPLYADFGSIDIESLMESLDNLCRNQQFLVIDEVHDCGDMKFTNKVLTDLIDRRYSSCRDTILIANQTGQAFAESIGDSILSRLNEHGAILECKWPSYRIPV